VSTGWPFISESLAIELAIFSVVAFVGSLLLIPWLIVRLPADYFDLRVPRKFLAHAHPALRSVAVVLKNIIGFVLLLAGVAMLVLPGQGVLTILIGVSLMDFPRKRDLEARLIGERHVFSGVNKLRARFHKPPFELSPR